MEPGELCLDCGLCCSRAIFSHLKFQAGDRERLIEHGHVELAKGTGIEFSCPAQEGPACTVYEARPAICRAWECATLIRVRRGDVTLEKARKRVREAMRLYRAFVALIPAGMGYSEAQRAATDNAKPDDLSKSQFQNLRLASVALEAYLDRHIRDNELQVLKRR